jgi:glycosyltransferase involved in cell wall biosynthesis
VIAGNLSRYVNTRPVVERDQQVLSRWYPIRTWFRDDPLGRVLPGHFRVRLRHLVDSAGLFVRSAADAVVIHAFETYPLFVLFALATRRKTLVVWTADGGIGPVPKVVRDRTDLFVFWSKATLDWSRERYPDVGAERCSVIHPGIDLTKWPPREPKQAGKRFSLLFVGGDFPRKGGDVLVEAFERHMQDGYELHIATHTAHLPEGMEERVARIPNAHLHLDLPAGSPEVQQLFRQADALVLPTREDLVPWVLIEAAAIGIPVLATPIWGIPELVLDGENGFHIKADDPLAIAEAAAKLKASPELCRQFAEAGRRLVVENFDAQTNTKRLLALIKSHVDSKRAARS